LPEQTDFSKASALRGVGGEGATKGGPPVSPLGPGPSAGRSFRSHTGTPRCALVWGCPNLTQTGSCCGCAPPPPPEGGGGTRKLGPRPGGRGGERRVSPLPRRVWEAQGGEEPPHRGRTDALLGMDHSLSDCFIGLWPCSPGRAPWFFFFFYPPRLVSMGGVGGGGGRAGGGRGASPRWTGGFFFWWGGGFGTPAGDQAVETRFPLKRPSAVRGGVCVASRQHPLG
jgi:hypothetical protein